MPSVPAASGNSAAYIVVTHKRNSGNAAIIKTMSFLKYWHKKKRNIAFLTLYFDSFSIPCNNTLYNS